MTKIFRFVFIYFFLITAVNAEETAYVIDKLLVGVHQDKNLNSAIIKVIPTGTKLSVIKWDGELAQIKDPEGVVGWVDVAYLMSDPPAQLLIEQLEQEKSALEARLEALEQQSTPNEALDADSDSGNTASEKLMTENTELKRKLSAERIRASGLQTEVAQLRTNAAAIGGPVELRIEDLEKANLQLRRELEVALQEIQQHNADSSMVSLLAKAPALVNGFSIYLLAGVVLAIIAAFGGGVYTMDYLSRRRHGGFRI